MSSTRCWLITSTTYGTWLPGDERGFVSTTARATGPRQRCNIPGASYDTDIPELRASARALMKGPAIYLTPEQACVVRDQFLETSRYRHWRMHALSIMANHFHAVIEASEETHSTKILGDLKGYASRALNRHWQTPASGTWWTQSGSRRPLNVEQAVIEAVRYVIARQRNPLITWLDETYRELVPTS